MFRTFSHGFIFGAFVGLFIDAWLARGPDGLTWQWWNFAITPFIFCAWGLLFMGVRRLADRLRGSSS